MQLIEHINHLGENDPLIREMIQASGAEGLPEVARRVEDLDFHAEASRFLNFPTASFKEHHRDATVHSGSDLPEAISNVGQYRLLQQIGRGGFGRVFEGYHHAFPDRRVAIKVFDRRWLDDIGRLEIERLVLQKLKHPNLVAAVDSGVGENGENYLVMQLIEGIRIDRFVLEQQLGFTPIAKLFAQIANAMYYAHGQDVVHRDLKPSNILVTAEGVPIVTDFGLAKRLNLTEGHSLTATGVLMGTLGYLAPEQADGKRREVTRSVDVYGLGATLYQVLTNHAPFEQENLLKALDDLKTLEPEKPRCFDHDIPLDLEQICLKCLAKSPADRYESMNALATDLQRFIQGVPVEARPLNWQQRLSRWAVANPTIAVLSCGLAMAILTGLIVSVAFWQRAASKQQQSELLLAKAQEIVQFGDKAAEKMLAQTPGSLSYRHERLKMSVQFLDELLDQFPEDNELYRDSATSYFRLGKVCCLRGMFADALHPYEVAQQRFSELAEVNPQDDTLQFDMFHCLLGLDNVDRSFLQLPYFEEGKMAEAYDIIQVLSDSHPEDTKYQDALLCMRLMICWRRFPNDVAKRIEFTKETFLKASALKASLPEPCQEWRYVGAAASQLCQIYGEQGDFDEAEYWISIAKKETDEFIQRPDLEPGELLDWANCLQAEYLMEKSRGNDGKAMTLAEEWHKFVVECGEKYPDYYVFQDVLARESEYFIKD